MKLEEDRVVRRPQNQVTTQPCTNKLAPQSQTKGSLEYEEVELNMPSAKYP